MSDPNTDARVKLAKVRVSLARLEVEIAECRRILKGEKLER